MPWKELIKEFGIKENVIGRSIVFPVQGRIVLMFLKNYSGLSDKMLIELLNENIEWQFFTGIYLGHHWIKNYKIVSQIRGILSKKLNIQDLQKTFYKYWSLYVEEADEITMDATCCYESEVRYPTAVKLL